jgi:hypothetical protein
VTTAKAATAADGSPAITLAGRGVDQGTGSTAFQSTVSVLTLGATSRKLPTCAARETTDCVLNATASSADLRYVGAGAATGPGGSKAGGVVWFGISTWGRWTSLAQGGQEFDVLIDTNANGDADFAVAAFTPADSDQPVALLLSAEGDPISALPINFLDGGVDTNAYDSDAMLIPVLASDIGITDATSSFPIQYQVVTFNEFGDPNSGQVDQSPLVDYDAVNPAIRTASPLFFDGNGETIPYTTSSPLAVAAKGARTDAAQQAEASSVDALLLHLNGRTGHRAEVVTLPR